jgi:hypothetical protein
MGNPQRSIRSSRRTRVVEQSPEFGFPPLSPLHTLRQRFHGTGDVLVNMRNDREGKKLGQLNLDGFTPGKRKLYDGIARMAEKVANRP